MKTTGLAGLVMVAGLALMCSNEEEVLTLGKKLGAKDRGRGPGVSSKT